MQISVNSLVPCKQNYEKSYNSYTNYHNLAPLKADTVSFSAKKSEFSGIDLLVVNKFKAPVEKFKTNDDLQNWCSEKIQKCLEQDYTGRQNETAIQRKSMLKEWGNYVLKENDAYNNAISLLIVDSITKNLKQNNDKLPPVLHKGVLADTISEIQTQSKNNQNYKTDFCKLYQTKLKEQYIKELSDNSEKENGNTGWIVIPGKENDSENFDKNVEKLKALSLDSWCTKSFNAQPYLSKGDFHVYIENGKPKLGVRFVGDKIEEIQGEKNNTKIPLKYLDTVKSYVQRYGLRRKAENEIKNAQKLQIKLDNLQQKLGKPFAECEPEELFAVFGMLKKIDDDGLLILKKYKQPDKDFNWEDIDVNENELFKDVKIIKGDADFYFSKITDFLSGGGEFESNRRQCLLIGR